MRESHGLVTITYSAESSSLYVVSVEVVLKSQVFAEAREPNAAALRQGRAKMPSEVKVAEPCELITLAPRSVLVMRFRSTAADLPRGFFHRYELMAEYLRQHGQEPASPPFAIYDNIDGNAADVEAGFVIGSDIEGSGDMIVKRMPGATVAALVHHGDYADIEPSYFKLLEWMHAHGVARSGRFMETYLNNPMETPDAELRTQLMVPVGPVSANDQ